MEEDDQEAAFRAAHMLKGMCEICRWKTLFRQVQRWWRSCAAELGPWEEADAPDLREYETLCGDPAPFD